MGSVGGVLEGNHVRLYSSHDSTRGPQQSVRTWKVYGVSRKDKGRRGAQWYRDGCSCCGGRVGSDSASRGRGGGQPGGCSTSARLGCAPGRWMAQGCPAATTPGECHASLPVWVSGSVTHKTERCIDHPPLCQCLTMRQWHSPFPARTECKHCHCDVVKSASLSLCGCIPVPVWVLSLCGCTTQQPQAPGPESPKIQAPLCCTAQGQHYNRMCRTQPRCSWCVPWWYPWCVAPRIPYCTPGVSRRHRRVYGMTHGHDTLQVRYV